MDFEQRLFAGFVRIVVRTLTQGIDWFSVHTDFPVQVRSRAVSGRADCSDLLSTLHSLARLECA